jgi:hypothetical protein
VQENNQTIKKYLAMIRDMYWSGLEN